MKTFKQKRLEKGFTQTTLAIMVGVSINSIRLWEIGVTKPHPENQKKLDNIFGKDEK